LIIHVIAFVVNIFCVTTYEKAIIYVDGKSVTRDVANTLVLGRHVSRCAGTSLQSSYRISLECTINIPEQTSTRGQ
jgi:hypothetical protein